MLVGWEQLAGARRQASHPTLLQDIDVGTIIPDEYKNHNELRIDGQRIILNLLGRKYIYLQAFALHLHSIMQIASRAVITCSNQHSQFRGMYTRPN
jgi:hypothetical protein